LTPPLPELSSYLVISIGLEGSMHRLPEKMLITILVSLFPLTGTCEMVNIREIESVPSVDERNIDALPGSL
jgi:hypothetical protein